MGADGPEEDDEADILTGTVWTRVANSTICAPASVLIALAELVYDLQGRTKKCCVYICVGAGGRIYIKVKHNMKSKVFFYYFFTKYTVWVDGEFILLQALCSDI